MNATRWRRALALLAGPALIAAVLAGSAAEAAPKPPPSGGVVIASGDALGPFSVPSAEVVVPTDNRVPIVFLTVPFALPRSGFVEIMLHWEHTRDPNGLCDGGSPFGTMYGTVDPVPYPQPGGTYVDTGKTNPRGLPLAITQCKSGTSRAAAARAHPGQTRLPTCTP